LSGCFANLVSEVFPVLLVVVLDGCLDLFGDFDVVDDDIFANMPGEGRGGGEVFSNGLKLGPVSLHRRAVLHSRLNVGQGISNLLQTIDDILDILGLEVSEGLLSILDDMLAITDALLDVSEALGIDGSEKEAFGEEKGISLGVFGGEGGLVDWVGPADGLEDIGQFNEHVVTSSLVLLLLITWLGRFQLESCDGELDVLKVAKSFEFENGEVDIVTLDGPLEHFLEFLTLQE